MTAKIIVALILAFAVLLAGVRLILWRRAGAASIVSTRWRLVALLALQPICATLLFLGLFPPVLPVAGQVMTVVTAKAPRTAIPTTNSRWIALPEATARSSLEQTPDLATALRRYPDTRRIKVLGTGLTPRDRDAARGLQIDFTPVPPPPGLVSLASPSRVAPGTSFGVGGQVAGVSEGRVELLDPAGRVTDTQKIDDEGQFIVSGTARAAGLTTFSVRVRNGQGRVVEQADVPVAVEAGAAPRILILAGAPGPEVKYLRRWATDAGFAVNTQMSIGGGIQIGDPAIAVNSATLRQFDVVIADDRSWASLGGGREAVLGAVSGGLGLVLRTGGPLDGSSRSLWRSFGFQLTGGENVVPIALPAPTEATVALTRSGIGGADTPADAALGEDVLPELGRLALTPGGNDTVALIRDSGGATLSAWRARGLGRVAVFTAIDSYGLTLTGRRGLYGDWWGDMLSAVARPVAGGGVISGETAWTGERLSLCNLPTTPTSTARVEGPTGAITTLAPDPAAAGCAGFWPAASGWHLLRLKGQAGPETVAFFFVQPADKLAGVRAVRDATETLRLNDSVAPASARGATIQGQATQTKAGLSWPWLLGGLIASSLLWGFERSNLGRGTAPKVET